MGGENVKGSQGKRTRKLLLSKALFPKVRVREKKDNVLIKSYSEDRVRKNDEAEERKTN
jgi:hypothetical protein